MKETAHFHPSSRVWTYISKRPLTEMEAQLALAALNRFTRQWTAHDQALKSMATLEHRQIVTLVVDESQAGASGCAIDKSVHFLQELGSELGTDFFERMVFFWKDADGVVHHADKDTFVQKFRSGEITMDSPMLNTLAADLQTVRTNRWPLLQESWHRRLL